MDINGLAQELSIEDPAACFALRQLCSTEHLAAGSLDDEACVRLVAVDLCTQEADGFWRVTAMGKTVCEQVWEPGRQRGWMAR